MCAAATSPPYHVTLFVKKPADEPRRIQNGDRVARFKIVPDLSMTELTDTLHAMWRESILRVEDDAGRVLGDFGALQNKPISGHHVFFAIVAPKEKPSTCVIS